MIYRSRRIVSASAADKERERVAAYKRHKEEAAFFHSRLVRVVELWRDMPLRERRALAALAYFEDIDKVAACRQWDSFSLDDRARLFSAVRLAIEFGSECARAIVDAR